MLVTDSSRNSEMPAAAGALESRISKVTMYSAGGLFIRNHEKV